MKATIDQLNKLSGTRTNSITPINKNSVAYRLAKEIIEGAKQIRPVYTSGKGRFTSNQDHTNKLIKILDLLDIKYVVSNDSPRGGKRGTLITIL